MKPLYFCTPVIILLSISCQQPLQQKEYRQVDTIVVIYKPQENFKERLEELDNEADLLKSLRKAIDYTEPTTHDFAVRLASKFPGEYNIGQICRIHDFIVSNWKYVNDPNKSEIFCSASRSIDNELSGDCDDFAILMSALLVSIGGEIRISFAYDEAEKGHAFTEVLVANQEEEVQEIVDEINTLYSTDQFKIYYTVDKSGRIWMNLDWFGNPPHPGGEYFNYVHRTIYYPTADQPWQEEEALERSENLLNEENVFDK